jgi:hypothetical protein
VKTYFIRGGSRVLEGGLVFDTSSDIIGSAGPISLRALPFADKLALMRNFASKVLEMNERVAEWRREAGIVVMH